MKKIFPILFLLFSCYKDKAINQPCKKDTPINSDILCIEIHEPVCGCHNITFSNSAHHQGVDKLGNNLTVTGTAPDGIIEGFEHHSHYYCVGVQWHPEFLITDFDKKFIQDFVNHVKKNI